MDSQPRYAMVEKIIGRTGKLTIFLLFSRFKRRYYTSPSHIFG